MTHRIQSGVAPTAEQIGPTKSEAKRPGPAPLQAAAATIAKPAAPALAKDGVALSATASEAVGFDFPPIWNFVATKVQKFYDATRDRTNAYNFPQILGDVPEMWGRKVASDIRSVYKSAAVTVKAKETYGELFKRVGTEMGVDPYALAAYCVFESYNSKSHSYNPHMTEAARGMYAAGIAATQAQDWKGKKIPGTDKKFPTTRDGTIKLLRANPEYGLRCLAAEMKSAYQKAGNDLAKAFPLTAYPAWGAPTISRGNYGTQAQYVSRAFALYQEFKQTDMGL